MSGAVGDPFWVTITGYYHPDGPGHIESMATHRFKSERAVKKLAELEVLRAAFEDWYMNTKQALVHAANS